MYKNIGAKIKVLAKAIAWIGILISLIVGVIFIIADGGWFDIEFFIGIGVLVGGSLLSWVSSWFMYGFGELIVKTTEIANFTNYSSCGK